MDEGFMIMGIGGRWCCIGGFYGSLGCIVVFTYSLILTTEFYFNQDLIVKFDTTHERCSCFFAPLIVSTAARMNDRRISDICPWVTAYFLSSLPGSCALSCLSIYIPLIHPTD